MNQDKLNDPMGLAAHDYINGTKGGKILIRSNIAEDDYIPVEYLFRPFDEMPPLEQKALELCKGAILDVGSGTGSHALELQTKGKNITCLDYSPLNCEVAKKRGIKKILEADFYNLQPETKYDTLLLMMNGIGIAGTLDNLPRFFEKTKELLAPNGQIILDSSDLRYLYIDGDSYLMPLNNRYYGEVVYSMRYKKAKCNPFNWLFIDSDLLAQKANENGFSFEKIAEGEHYDYLARLIAKH